MKYLLTILIFFAVSCSDKQGPPGQAGSSCSVSSDSNGATISCPDGTSASVTNGTNGTNGKDAQPCQVVSYPWGAQITCPAGPNGESYTAAYVTNGTNGTDATPVTAVQFCPNVTPSYPSTFPEYGVCIGSSIYGVYSANGGFLALLPPGEYNSDGENASCTFTIGDNCTITAD